MPGIEEGLLEEVLGRRTVAGQDDEVVEDLGGEQAVQLGEGILVSPPRCLDQRAEIQRSRDLLQARHWPRTMRWGPPLRPEGGRLRVAGHPGFLLEGGLGGYVGSSG